MNEKILHEARNLIAGFFKQRREELGYSQDKLAELTGLNRSTIKRLEAAQFWPGLKQYLIICEALKVFPLIATYEGDGEFSRMMRETWTNKQGKDMSVEEALRLKDDRYIRRELNN
jgi:transcriptional regulator with XRE-family HTH domain